MPGTNAIEYYPLAATHYVSHGTAPPPIMNAPLAGFERQIEGLRDVGALFFQRGWSVGTSSNYSVVVRRAPIELIVTASGLDKGRLNGHDFVRVDAVGRPVTEYQPRSSAETLLHVEIAKQSDAGAILHTHSVWATLLSDIYFQDGGFHIDGYEMLKGLDGIPTHEANIWVEIFENTQDIPALAQQISDRFQDTEQPLTYGFLIRKHGLYTWGKDVDAARRHVEIFEFLFEVLGRRMQMTPHLTSISGAF